MQNELVLGDIEAQSVLSLDTENEKHFLFTCETVCKEKRVPHASLSYPSTKQSTHTLSSEE